MEGEGRKRNGGGGGGIGKGWLMFLRDGCQRELSPVMDESSSPPSVFYRAHPFLLYKNGHIKDNIRKKTGGRRKKVSWGGGGG